MQTQALAAVPLWQNRVGEVVRTENKPSDEWRILFEKSEKQTEACDILNSHLHSLLVGGGRSTKTSIIIRNIVARALRKPSRHLITRYCFNHAMQSIWYDTFPKIVGGFWPFMEYKENKKMSYIEIPTIDGSGTSEIWFGGTDSKERTEKILGNEYSTIFCNEVSQIDYDTILMLQSRLAENSGLPLRFYYDLNPVGKKHWTYQLFIKGINPEDGRPVGNPEDYGHLFMNPIDNPHLPAATLKIYQNLPKRKRQRFLEGLYLDDIEGALWTDEMVSHALGRPYGELIKTIIAVDPAVVHKEGNDETGIIACGLDMSRNGVVLADYTAKGSVSTKTWAQRVVNAYHNHDANYVVAEVNQGGDLVEDVLKNYDRSIKVVKVRASKGKFARAEPIAELYELGEVSHAKEMSDLESELTEWVPMNTTESPNRLDALVWGLTHLLVKKPKRVNA